MLASLVNFEGRATRAEFWTVHLPAVALQLAITAICLVSWVTHDNNGVLMVSDLSLHRLMEAFVAHRSQILPVILVCMVPQVAVAFRRMNDRGRPAGWVVFFVWPVIATLAIGAPKTGSFNPSWLTAITMVMAAWYFIELGMMPGLMGSAERLELQGERSAFAAWLDKVAHKVAPGLGATAPEPAAEQRAFSHYSSAEAAVDRAAAERRSGDRREIDRRVGMPDTREVKVERRSADRRNGSAADRRGGAGSQGFGRRG